MISTRWAVRKRETRNDSAVGAAYIEIKKREEPGKRKETGGKRRGERTGSGKKYGERGHCKDAAVKELGNRKEEVGGDEEY